MKRFLKVLKSTIKIGLAIALGVGGWYGYSYYQGQQQEDTGIGELPTVEAAVRDITVSVSATGLLQPIRIVEVKSKASGEILEMPVEMGDLVRAGDLIAQIDTEIIDQELKQAQADYESAKIRLEIADKQFARAQELFAQDLISENDLETSQQNYTSAEGQNLRAEAALELAKERLEDATVRAPITGTVITKTVETGQIIQSSTSNVSGGTTLVQMADLSELEIRTLVDEIDIGQVKPGLFVESKVEAFPDKNFEGEVMKIEPNAQVQQSVTTFPVLSRIDNTDGLLLPGMNADVNIIIHRRPRVLSVPNEAVRTPDDARQVVELLGLGSGTLDDGESLMTSTPGGGYGQLAAGGSADGSAAGSSSAGPDARAPAEQSSDDYVPTEQELREALAELRRQADDDGDRNGRGGGFGGGDPGGSTGARSGGGGATRGRGGMDLSDPDSRRRMWQRVQGQLQSQAKADDPWGMSGGRREEAVVFVLEPAGNIVPRNILAGVRDWEFTEVLAGLQPGDELVVLPSTSLLRSQEQMRERFSRRGGIPGLPGGGGRGGRR